MELKIFRLIFPSAKLVTTQIVFWNKKLLINSHKQKKEKIKFNLNKKKQKKTKKKQ